VRQCGSFPVAPEGVTIDDNGRITVAAGAALDLRDDILVRAVYKGQAYEKLLTLTKIRLVADGVTYYIWILYADNAQGSGISNNPAGKDYIT
jgi:hypothetical protein